MGTSSDFDDLEQETQKIEKEVTDFDVSPTFWQLHKSNILMGNVTALAILMDNFHLIET